MCRTMRPRFWMPIHMLQLYCLLLAFISLMLANCCLCPYWHSLAAFALPLNAALSNLWNSPGPIKGANRSTARFWFPLLIPRIHCHRNCRSRLLVVVYGLHDNLVDICQGRIIDESDNHWEQCQRERESQVKSIVNAISAELVCKQEQRQ